MLKVKLYKVLVLVVLAVSVLSLTGCGDGDGSGSPVQTGTEEVDKAVETMVENQTGKDTCNLGLMGIGGITDPKKRLEALANCLPKEGEGEKYMEMVEEAEKELAAQ